MKHEEWLELKNWAVIGASENTDSYGYKITRQLFLKGYNTIPISPKYERVEGIQVHKSISDYEGPIDVVDFVVNPSIGIKILDEVIDKGIKRILLQPGTASYEIIEKAKAHDIEVLEGCILVMLAWK